MLAEWTTFGLGGPAERLVEVDDVDALSRLLGNLDDEGGPVLLLGEGSNVLISDDGFPGTVVHMALAGRQARTDGDEVVVTLGAGERWAPFVASCVAGGLSGVECLAGIPGLVGATPIQNVGAYGQEVAQTIENVTVWDRRARQLRAMSPTECRFSYRSSLFKRNDRYVVTSVAFRLQRSNRSRPLRYAELVERLGRDLGAQAGLQETADAVLALRRAKAMVVDPSDPGTRSAGSFFVNPVLGGEELGRLRHLAPEAPGYAVAGGVRVPAAWLVEHAGFHRGYGNEGAVISTKHALALTALEGGRAADVLALAREVREGVRAKFGITLEPEPVLVGLHL